MHVIFEIRMWLKKDQRKQQQKKNYEIESNEFDSHLPVLINYEQ